MTDDERRAADAEMRRNHECLRERELLQRAAGAREAAIQAVRESWAHEFERTTGKPFDVNPDGGADDGGDDDTGHGNGDGDGDGEPSGDGGGGSDSAGGNGAKNAGEDPAKAGAGTGGDSDAAGGSAADDSDGTALSQGGGASLRPPTVSSRSRRGVLATPNKPRVTGLSSLQFHPQPPAGDSGVSDSDGGNSAVAAARVFWELEVRTYAELGCRRA